MLKNNNNYTKRLQFRPKRPKNYKELVQNQIKLKNIKNIANFDENLLNLI